MRGVVRMLQLRMRRFNVPAYAYSHGAYSVADSIPDAGPCTTSDADANLVAGTHAHLGIGTNNWNCLSNILSVCICVWFMKIPALIPKVVFKKRNSSFGSPYFLQWYSS